MVVLVGAVPDISFRVSERLCKTRDPLLVPPPNVGTEAALHNPDPVILQACHRLLRELPSPSLGGSDR